MKKSALIFVWTIIATGIAVLGCALTGFQVTDYQGGLLCLVIALLASTFKVRLPGMTGTISPAFVFLLISVATRSWSETVIIAALSGMVQCFWHAKKRPSALQLAFNAAAMSISGGIAHGVVSSMRSGASSTALVLGGSGVALLVSNTLMVATILCLVQETPFRTIWRSIQMWAVPYYIAGGLLASIWVSPGIAPAATVLVLSVISAYLLNVCLREVIRMISPEPAVR